MIFSYSIEEIKEAQEAKYSIIVYPDMIREYSTKDKTLIVDLGACMGYIFVDDLTAADKNLNDLLRQVFQNGCSAHVMGYFPSKFRKKGNLYTSDDKSIKEVFLVFNEATEEYFNTLDEGDEVPDFTFVKMCNAGAIFYLEGLLALCKFDEISKAKPTDYEKFLRLTEYHSLNVLHKGKKPFKLLVSRRKGKGKRHLQPGHIIPVIMTGKTHKNMAEIEITPNQIGMMEVPEYILKNPEPRICLGIITKRRLHEDVPIFKFVN